MRRVRLGKNQLICLIAIANGYQCNDYSDKVCLALKAKHMLTPGFGMDSGWVLTQGALEWLAVCPAVHIVTYRTYYLNPE